MKKLIFLIAVFLFTALSCEKEVILPPEEFTMNVTIPPDPAAELITCLLPDGSLMPLPSSGKISGTAAFLGTLDAAKSTLNILSCDYNPNYNALDMDIRYVLENADGDALTFEGSGQTYFTNVTAGYLEVKQGTGKFKDAYGWMYVTSTIDPITLTVTSTGDGMVSPPKN